MYTILPESTGNIIGIQVEDYMRAEDYETLLPFIETLIAQHGTIRILSDLRDYKGVEFRAVLKAFPYSFKYSANVEKKAVITDKHWIYAWTKLLAPFFKTEIRCFPSTEIDQAWEWVSK